MNAPVHRTFEAQSAAEALFLEQAQAYYREMTAAAENAPYGTIVHHAENFALLQGRELVRKSLENVLQEQVERAEKKAKRKPVHAAAKKNTSAPAKKRS